MSAAVVGDGQRRGPPRQRVRGGHALKAGVVLLAALLAGEALAQASVAAPGTDAEPLAGATAAGAPNAAAGRRETGRIAWYGARFAGRRTASGQRFDPGALTMAHRTLPFGTRVKVTNTANGKSVVVRVNDRGPTQQDRIGDVSREAARRLGMLKSGLADAELEVVADE